MILDDIARWRRYGAVHPRFAEAFAFLARADLRALPDGRHLVDGDRLYVAIAGEDGRGRDGARLEAHRRYIDIQCTLEGVEEIGWCALPRCAAPFGPHDPERDIRFFADRPEVWCPLPPGRFAVFFPEDAHAPLAGHGRVRKAVAKIAVDAAFS